MIQQSGDQYPFTELYKFFSDGTQVGKFKAVDEGDKISIWKLEIFPEFIGKKFGQQMMSEIIEYFHQILWLCVDVRNIPARKIYEKAGFVYEENSIQSIKTMIRIPEEV